LNKAARGGRCHCKLRRTNWKEDRFHSVSKLTLKAIEARKHWLTVEWLPKYAPELNDIEIVWHDLKAHHLAHQTFADADALERTRARPPMRVISVNLGLPRTVQWKGKTVSTAIFKTPVSDRITLRFLNLDGDRQADLSVHGGRDKAVYAYPAEYYAYWHREFPDMALPWGMFGENLTTEGLREDDLQVATGFASAPLRSSSRSRECHASSLA